MSMYIIIFAIIFAIIAFEVVVTIAAEIKEKIASRSKIIFICGDVCGLKDEFNKVFLMESMSGNVVLTVPFISYDELHALSEEEHLNLFNLHYKKINMADEILVIHDGFIDSYTKELVIYCEDNNKCVTRIHKENLEHIYNNKDI